MGSHLMVDYGMNMTIKYGCKLYEYFDVANIKYYDAILGTLFVRRLGITMDFTSPGAVCVGNKIILQER